MNPRSPNGGVLDDSAPTLDGVDPPTLSLRGQRAAPAAAVVRDGRYDIGELIGSGGQGDVYRVYDRELRCHMVMKVIGPEGAGDPIALARFVQEAQI